MNIAQTLTSNSYSKDEISSFIQSVAAVYMLDRPFVGNDDRREVERMNVTMPVLICPLDDEFQKLGYLHRGITRDISRKGIGLVTTSPVRPGHSMLTLEPCHGEVFDVVARITYCNEIGNYFQVGYEFLTE